MYLSKLVLNGRDRSVLRSLSNSHTLHQRIMQAFPDEQQQEARANWQVLFRHEPESDVILVQSNIEPDWDRLPEGYLLGQNVKPFYPAENQLAVGRIVQFRLKANPSKRDKQTGKLIGMFHQADQIAWLERQAVRHGFKLLGVDVIPTPHVFGVKGKGTAPIRIATVLFQGILQITDSSLFVEAIQHGVGRGRSYGCGLLSIARVNPN